LLPQGPPLPGDLAHQAGHLYPRGTALEGRDAYHLERPIWSINVVTRSCPLPLPLLLGGLLVLAGCQTQSPAPPPGMPIVHLGLLNKAPAVCHAAPHATSNAPLLGDARLSVTDGSARLTGCIVNPGPLDYSAVVVEIAFFDAGGHLLNALSRDSAMLPAYAASPAEAAPAPNWAIPLDVSGDPNATEVEVLVHTLLCPGASGRGCVEEHDTGAVRLSVSAAKS